MNIFMLQCVLVMQIFRNEGISTVAHEGKTQLNVELDTQQAFAIQNNFSRNTTIFRDTKQFFPEHNNLSRTIFRDTKQFFTEHNNLS